VKVYVQRGLKKIRTALGESDKMRITKPVEHRRYSPKKRSSPELDSP
jgi:hypothetical protein